MSSEALQTKEHAEADARDEGEEGSGRHIRDKEAYAEGCEEPSDPEEGL